MSTSTTPSRRDRTRLLVAAAAAAVVAATGVGLLIGDGEDEPAAKGAKPTPTRPVSTATYSLPASAGGARCMMPEQNTIRGLDVAFVGKVTARRDDQVTLAPSRFYTGPKSDRVVLDVARAEGAVYEALPVDFQVGRTYVVAVEQGQVRLCGFTAEANPTLQATYEAALR